MTRLASRPATRPASQPTSQPTRPALLDPARIEIVTRAPRSKDCGNELEAYYLRVRSKQPNRLVIRWNEQNMGTPFLARVVVQRGVVRLDILPDASALAGLICGMQVYHLTTVIKGLPAGRYRVIGPLLPSEKVGKRIVKEPRQGRRVVVSGLAADPQRRWRARRAKHRIEP